MCMSYLTIKKHLSTPEFVPGKGNPWTPPGGGGGSGPSDKPSDDGNGGPKKRPAKRSSADKGTAAGSKRVK